MRQDLLRGQGRDGDGASGAAPVHRRGFLGVLLSGHSVSGRLAAAGALLPLAAAPSPVVVVMMPTADSLREAARAKQRIKNAHVVQNSGSASVGG